MLLKSPLQWIKEEIYPAFLNAYRKLAELDLEMVKDLSQAFRFAKRRGIIFYDNFVLKMEEFCHEKYPSVFWALSFLLLSLKNIAIKIIHFLSLLTYNVLSLGLLLINAAFNFLFHGLYKFQANIYAEERGFTRMTTLIKDCYNSIFYPWQKSVLQSIASLPLRLIRLCLAPAAILLGAVIESTRLLLIVGFMAALALEAFTDILITGLIATPRVVYDGISALRDKCQHCRQRDQPLEDEATSPSSSSYTTFHKNAPPTKAKVVELPDEIEIIEEPVPENTSEKNEQTGINLNGSTADYSFL